MTREEARKAAEVMLAYANGEEIETLNFGEYTSCEPPSFNWSDYKIPGVYRVKPKKPTYRPFKDRDECMAEMLKHKPFGWVKNICMYFAITCVYDHIYIDNILLTNTRYSFKRAYDSFCFADGTPFGIREE